jgi:DNA gyrase subunit A
MSILNGAADVSAEERAAYLKRANQLRRQDSEDFPHLNPLPEGEGASEEEGEKPSPTGRGLGEGQESEIELSDARFTELASREQFILSVTANGYGKRSSSYEYRVTGRGGSGIVNIITSARNGEVVASFPINEADQLMLMTDSAKLIRTPIHDVRIAGRNTQGVTLFKVEKGERVVSAVRIDGAMVGGESEEEETVSASDVSDEQT